MLRFPDHMKLTLIATVLVMNFLSFAVSAQEIGLQLYSLDDQFRTDAATTMAKVREMGIKQVEMKGTHGLAFPEFIKLLAINNINVISFEADYEKLQKFPQVVADEARSYGAKYVVCSVGRADGALLTPEQADKIAQSFNHAGKIISRNGMILCYQPSSEDFGAHSKGTVFDYLVEKLDSRFVHLEMDVFSAKRGGQDPPSLMKKYPTRFILVQLNDGKATGVLTASASPSPNVVLGAGDVGIKKVMEAARELGIQHLFIEDESSKAEKQIPKSIAYLRTLNVKDSAKK